jgi:hypothetical protein
VLGTFPITSINSIAHWHGMILASSRRKFQVRAKFFNEFLDPLTRVMDAILERQDYARCIFSGCWHVQAQKHNQAMKLEEKMIEQLWSGLKGQSHAISPRMYYIVLDSLMMHIVSYVKKLFLEKVTESSGQKVQGNDI